MAFLHSYDLQRLTNILPKKLVEAMKNETLPVIYVGGGCIRSVVTGEPVNDIDLFVGSMAAADTVVTYLQEDFETVVTDNATTIKAPLPLQVIHRWTFESVEKVVDSFDFTICCAAIVYNRAKKTFESYTHPEFYPDLAAKRLTYLQPIRNEDAGGSIIRVLKYYQKGYRISIQSLAHVIARLVKGIDVNRIEYGLNNEREVGLIINGLLKEVDPFGISAVD